MSGGRSEGRRRLGLVLGTLAVLGMATLMAVVVVFYGPPYDPIWWLVMALVLVAAYLSGRLALVPAVEWVMEGYGAHERRGHGAAAQD